MDKQKLHDFVTNTIKDDEAGSESAFHDYLKSKMRQVLDKLQPKQQSPMEQTAGE